MNESRRGRRGGRRLGGSGTTGGAAPATGKPYITRKIPYFEVLNEEGLQTIENNAETILEEAPFLTETSTKTLRPCRPARTCGSTLRRVASSAQSPS